ncbi:response regulator [Glaciecola sp. 2405UD65-10]|uniref:response regulator n=1 Tax=Glaciecola sp. 2405UD65-10 TaxID=3397244 RepID=UPI003B5A9187
MYKVLIADDHPLFRNALNQVLSGQLTMQVAESKDFASTIAFLEADPDIDLVFLDLNMPGNNGLASISAIRVQFPNTLIIVVSAEEQESVITKCVQLGASAFIPKSLDLNEMCEAVNHVLEGQQWLPKDIQLNPNASNENASIEKLEQLTPHQLKVLVLIADGLLNKQIAYELSISESTVKQHASAVLKKLGVYNRTQAGIIYQQAIHID